MSRKLSLLLSPLFITSMLLACSNQVPEIYKHKDNVDPITIYGRELKLEFTDKKYEEDLKYADDLIAAIKAGKESYRKISEKIGKLRERISWTENQYRKANVIADMTVKNEDIETSNKVYAASLKLNSYVTKVVVAIYGSKYKSDYFYGMSNKEIEEYMKAYDEGSSDALTEASAKQNNIKTQYQIGELGVYDAVRQFVSAGNEIAKLSGYSNYVDYAYANIYSRKYVPNDTKDLIDHAKNYIYPVHLETYYYVQDAISKLNESEKKAYDEIAYGCFTHQLDTFDAFARDLGGSYYKNFKYLFDSGNYFLSEVVNPNTTAYSWEMDGEPFIYFGAEYQDVHTLAHEFGHYNAALVGSDVGMAYDLLETQSQGSEALFYNYLLNNVDDNEKAYDIYFLDRMDGFMGNFYIGVAINELEIQLYNKENIMNMSDEQITKVVTDILAYIRSDSEGVYTSVPAILDTCISSPVYYISYSTSAAASLELMAIAYNSYSKAKGMYNKIYANYSKDKSINDFMDVILYSGLSNVFEQRAYMKINDFATSFLQEARDL